MKRTILLACTPAGFRNRNPSASAPMRFEVDPIWWNTLVRRYRDKVGFSRLSGHDRSMIRDEIRSTIYFTLKAAGAAS